MAEPMSAAERAIWALNLNYRDSLGPLRRMRESQERGVMRLGAEVERAIALRRRRAGQAALNSAGRAANSASSAAAVFDPGLPRRDSDERNAQASRNSSQALGRGRGGKNRQRQAGAAAANKGGDAAEARKRGRRVDGYGDFDISRDSGSGSGIPRNSGNRGGSSRGAQGAGGPRWNTSGAGARASNDICSLQDQTDQRRYGFPSEQGRASFRG